MTLVARLFLGLLFLAAGAMKVGDPGAFTEALGEYKILPEILLWPSALVLPWLEVALGAALIVGVHVRLAAALTGLLSGLFALAIASALIRGLEVDCGCFSGGAAANVSHILLNLVMLASACLLVDKGAGPWSLDQKLGGGAILDLGQPYRPALALPTLALVALVVGGVVGTRQPYWAERLFRPINSGLIVFEPSEITLGDLWQGETVERTAIYRNVSAKTLMISRAGSSCNCTTPKLTTRTLLPGQAGELSVGFRAGNRPGQARSRVSLYLEAQGRPVVLELSGEVKPSAEVNPDSLTLGPGETGEVEVLLHRPYAEKPELIVLTQSPPVEVEILPTQDDTKYRLLVRLGEGADNQAEGQSIWLVQLRLDSGEDHPLRFYVKKA